MSANTWGYYRDEATGKVQYLPCHVADLYDNLAPTEDNVGCVDCSWDKPELEVEEFDLELDDEDEDY